MVINNRGLATAGLASRAGGVAGSAAGAVRSGRRERRKLEIYRRIHRAASELFEKKGYEATTVEEIAERADVAKATVFNYFPRKESLLAAMAEDMVERLAAELGPPGRWRGTGREQLRRIFLKLAELAEQDRELSRVVLFENMHNLWLRSQEDPAIHTLRSHVRAVLERARAAGEIRREADGEIVARLLESIYFTTLVDWLSEGSPGRVFRRELNQKLDIVFRGLDPAETSGRRS